MAYGAMERPDDAAEVIGPLPPRGEEVLTPEALALVGRLHRKFNARRLELLDLRLQRQARFDVGEKPDFLDETAAVRAGGY